MGNFGGCDATSLQKSLDYIFEGKIGMSEDDYRLKLISATADGASIDFGMYSLI